MKITKKLANIMSSACLCAASAASLAQPPDLSLTFPMGQACPDFGLTVDIFDSDHRVMKEFRDKANNLVRLLSAGQGSTLVFRNDDTGKQFFLRSNGSVASIVFNADGSQTFTVTGHNVLILFPGDVPTGPSTTLYVGRLVFLQQGSTTTLLRDPVGARTDICAALR